MDIKHTQKIQHPKALPVEPVLPTSNVSGNCNPGKDAEAMQKSDFSMIQVWPEEDQALQTQIKETTAFTTETKLKQIPGTIGLSYRTASKLISARGFRIAVTTAEHSENIPEGYVVMTVPMPGSGAVENSGIKIILSKGPQPKEKEKTPQELIALGDVSGAEKEKRASSAPSFMDKALAYPYAGKPAEGTAAIEIEA